MEVFHCMKFVNGGVYDTFLKNKFTFPSPILASVDYTNISL